MLLERCLTLRRGLRDASTSLQPLRRWLSFAGVCLLAGGLSAGCGGGSGNAPTPISTPAPSNIATIDRVIAQNFAGFGVELAIYKNGIPLYIHGYGLRDRGLPDSFGGFDFWHIAQPDVMLHLSRGRLTPDANTLFDFASVSKEFTAGAILLLQQDGALSVNDPLSKYLPSFPNGNQIPLLYLLQHRSGLVDYNTFGEYPDFASAYVAFMAAGQMNYAPIVDKLATFPLKFTPGTQYDYSNTNYLLLGMVVAQVSGKPLGTFLQQRIFQPLGVAHIQQGFPTPPISDLALGYAEFNTSVQRTWQPNLQWLAGPGGLTGTVGDLETWDRAVRRPGIFSVASLAQMFAPSPFPQPYGTYAAGWFISTLNGHRFVWHDGAVTGYQTMNATFPNDGIDIIIFTNDGSGLDPYFVIPQLLGIALTMTAASR